jgi:hypothetical protein
MIPPRPTPVLRNIARGSPRLLQPLPRGAPRARRRTPTLNVLDPTKAYAADAAEASFKDLLHAIFCRSWTTYTKAKEETLCQLELQEFDESQLKEQATAPVAMDVVLITTDSPELADAVKAQVARHTKNLQSQVSRLTNKINKLENMPSGVSKSHAQPKKKKDSTLHAAKLPPAAQKAAAVVKDTPPPRQGLQVGEETGQKRRRANQKTAAPREPPP